MDWIEWLPLEWPTCGGLKDLRTHKEAGHCIAKAFRYQEDPGARAGATQISES